jgi:hypothetical protein
MSPYVYMRLLNAFGAPWSRHRTAQSNRNNRPILSSSNFSLLQKVYTCSWVGALEPACQSRRYSPPMPLPFEYH